MTVGILQPGYLPWLGCCAQVATCDIFVIYDCVQYDRESWRNRNRVRTRDGWTWLTVPVRLAGRFGQTINEVEIDATSKWQRKHARTVAQEYGAAPFYRAHQPFLDVLFTRRWDRLVDLNLFALTYLLDAFGIHTPLVSSSSLKLTGRRNERLLQVCTTVGATRYLSTDAGSVYLDIAMFEAQGISVHFQHYAHPVYRQAFDGFISHLSALDLLLNHGPRSRDILMNAPDGPSDPTHVPQPDRRLHGGRSLSGD